MNINNGWGRLRREAQIAVVVVGLIVSIGSLYAALDLRLARYALAADLDKHIREHTAEYRNLQSEVLEGRRAAVRRDIFDLEQRPRALSIDERRHLEELKENDADLTDRIRGLR